MIVSDVSVQTSHRLASKQAGFAVDIWSLVGVRCLDMLQKEGLCLEGYTTGIASITCTKDVRNWGCCLGKIIKCRRFPMCVSCVVQQVTKFLKLLVTFNFIAILFGLVLGILGGVIWLLLM